MDEIAAANSKLQLLEQARAIEENEKNKKIKRSQTIRAVIHDQDKQESQYLSIDKLQKERRETHHLVSAMKDNPGLQEISNVLGNFEGMIL